MCCAIHLLSQRDTPQRCRALALCQAGLKSAGAQGLTDWLAKGEAGAMRSIGPGGAEAVRPTEAAARGCTADSWSGSG